MLYIKLGRPALGKTLRIVGQRAASEEIVQEVFAKLWEKKMAFPNVRSAYAWIYKCCTNAAIDFIRASGNSSLPLEDVDQVSSVDLETQTEARAAWKRLFPSLSSDEASLFIYKNVEGLSQDEVAEVMQISRRTVNRLQEKLESKLEKVRRRNVG